MTVQEHGGVYAASKAVVVDMLVMKYATIEINKWA